MSDLIVKSIESNTTYKTSPNDSSTVKSNDASASLEEARRSDNQFTSAPNPDCSKSFAYGMPGVVATPSGAGVNSLSNAEFATQMRSKFGSVSDSLLEQYKNFSALTSENNLYINQPGSDNFFKLNGSKWDKVESNSQLEKLKEATKITKLDLRSFSSEAQKKFSNNNLYSVGKDLVTNAKGSNDFYKLNNNQWEPLDNQLLANHLTSLSEPKKPVVNSDSSDALLKGSSDSSNPIKNSLVGDLVASVDAWSGFATGLSSANLSSLIPNNSLPAALIEKSIEKYHDMKFFEEMALNGPEAAAKVLESGINLKERKILSDDPSKAQLSEIEDLKGLPQYFKERFSENLDESEIYNHRGKSYPKGTPYLMDIYTPERNQMFKEAMTSGKLNGFDISRAEAKKHYLDSSLYLGIINNKFDRTSNGRPSAGSFDLATYFYADDVTIKKDLKKFGF